MRDLTREEQEDLIRLLGIVIANGRGSLEADDAGTQKVPPPARWQIVKLVHAAELVRDACSEDLVNQKG